MNDKINNSLIYVQKQKSGFLWVGVGLVILLLAIPLMIYGLGRATYNGIVWVGQHPTRKLNKLQRKQAKIRTKQEITVLKDEVKEYKEAKKAELGE